MTSSTSCAGSPRTRTARISQGGRLRSRRRSRRTAPWTAAGARDLAGLLPYARRLPDADRLRAGLPARSESEPAPAGALDARGPAALPRSALLDLLRLADGPARDDRSGGSDARRPACGNPDHGLLPGGRDADRRGGPSHRAGRRISTPAGLLTALRPASPSASPHEGRKTEPRGRASRAGSDAPRRTPRTDAAPRSGAARIRLRARC